MSDLSGKVIGRITVLKKSERKGVHGEVYYDCICKCGNTKAIRYSTLIAGKTISCGCLKDIANSVVKTKDLTNQRFGRLKVLEQQATDTGRGKALWRCQCDCGETTIVRGDCLNRGVTKSCGCLRREEARTRRVGKKKKPHHPPSK